MKYTFNNVQSASQKRRPNSIRLREYDYSLAGAYFVTICTYNRECLFGDIRKGVSRLNRNADIVQDCWDDLPNHYPYVELGEFVIMPNHVHGIILLSEFEGSVGAGFQPARAGHRPAPTNKNPIKRHGLPEIGRAFKTFSGRRVNEICGTSGMPVWQRNYFEHVIRNEKSLNLIRRYIVENPGQWETDPENPAYKSKA